ncbi:hypothetical protein GA0115233_101287 [Streptomyces sp. DI166]|nr:hypothetical protein GA0115233_101287 [Streptomyces sp. DI166]
MPAPKVWVTGLTVGATAIVVALAVQADKGAKPTVSAAPRPSASATADPKPAESESPKSKRVPDGSGTGRRIVYSLGENRVWLVDASEATRRTFAVWPGTVDPEPGKYTVGQRTEDPITGSDGVRIEHVVYFAVRSGVNVAFSNAVDGSSPPPPADGARTGGIRMSDKDGSALWAFGTAGTTVTVVK